MKKTSLTLTGYNSDTQVDRLKVEGERFSAFSLRPEGFRDCVRTA